MVLILGAAGLHVLYLARDCPLDLAQDEAHYWDWSRHLDWSYYSKGPLVAWLIRGGCELFGNTPLGVRLPAVGCGALLLAGLYVLTVQVFRSERLACAVVAVALTLPAIAAGSTLMTIDSPYTCCWCWALVLGHRALFRGSTWAWIGTGLVAGVGILAKYTMVLYLPALGLFLLTSREHRILLLRRGFWLMIACAALCCLPILICNVQNDWVTVKHVFRLAGVSETPTTHGPSIHWEGPLRLHRHSSSVAVGILVRSLGRGHVVVAAVGRERCREALLVGGLQGSCFSFFSVSVSRRRAS